MPSEAHAHEVLLDQVKQEYSAIFQQASQGIYIYLDDPHWICNDRLAALLGYTSAAEFHSAATAAPFLDVAVATESQQPVVDAYMKSANSRAASSIPVTWKKKGGGTLKTQTIFVPISYAGSGMTLHFVTPL